MTAFRAAFADMKLVKTRGVTQLIFEIPTEEFDAAYEILGGVPLAGKERWFGIAAIKEPLQRKEADPKSTDRTPVKPQPDTDKPSAGVKRDWRAVPYPQQAGIRINEPTFAAYLREEHSDEWHETGDADACLKLICRINSKRELLTNHKAALMWHQIDTSYAAWKALEHA